MSTRSRIAIKNADGTYRSIYCHFDGYPDGVGATLKEHYTDPTKINQLLDLGDISALGSEIGEKHDFDDRNAPQEWTRAYGRDRGETGIDASESPTMDDLRELTKGSGGEYLYWFANGEWNMWDIYPEVE